MIYNQSSYAYFLAVLFLIVIFFRLHSYFKKMFDKEVAWILPLIILLHPLSIDLFLAPNLISGAIAFWLFVESQLFFIHRKPLAGLSVLIIASLCNLPLIFVLLYSFWKYRENLSRFKYPIFIFIFFGLLYLYKNLLTLTHNPIKFFITYLHSLILPFSMTVLNYSFFPFSKISLALVLVVLGILLWRQKFNPLSKPYWPLLILPALGVFFHPWIEPYRFWHDLIYSPSTYLCITFAFFTILAMHAPKSILYTFLLVGCLVSLKWSPMWLSYSSMLEVSIGQIPDKHEHLVSMRRLLAWEYFNEGKKSESLKLMKELSASNPNNLELESDLKIIEQN